MTFFGAFFDFCLLEWGMGSSLNSSENESVYSLQVSGVRGGDYFQVPKCFLRQGSPSTRLGTSFGQGGLCGK